MKSNQKALQDLINNNDHLSDDELTQALRELGHCVVEFDGEEHIVPLGYEPTYIKVKGVLTVVLVPDEASFKKWRRDEFKAKINSILDEITFYTVTITDELAHLIFPQY